jgi:hypothetical protein
MARPPANKPVVTDGAKPAAFTLPAPIQDPMQELLFLLGNLYGNHTETADRITQLVLTLQAQYNARIAELERAE